MITEILLEYGFLQLTALGSGRIESVKGSAIYRVTPMENGGSLLTIGLNGWSIEVNENREPILKAIAASYSQASRR